jgi:hypothetical protein
VPIDESGNKADSSFSSGAPGTPVCACGGHADFNPSYVTTSVPANLVPDERGVHGYMPKPDSPFAKSPPWPDWTNPEAVAGAHAIRVDYHRGLAQEVAWVDAQRANGRDEESIARELVDMRNKARMSKYSEDKLPMLYERNLKEHGNMYGPTYETLLEKYHGDPSEVINAGTRSNTGMDVLCGVATVKPAKL